MSDAQSKEPVVEELPPIEMPVEMTEEAPAPEVVKVPAPVQVPVAEDPPAPPVVLPFRDINAAATQAFADHLAMVEASKMRERDAQTLVSRIKADKAAMTVRHDQEAGDLETRHRQETDAMTMRFSDANEDAVEAGLNIEDAVSDAKDAGRALILLLEGYVGS